MKFQPKHLKTFWNKKNILFISLILAFCLTIGGTVAWLTANDDPTNYDFIGAWVDCAVVEDTFTQGTSTTKSNVRIENTGNTEAYIRATYVVNWVKDGTQNTETPVVHPTAPVKGTDYTVTFGEGWVLKEDGYYYYSLPVTQGDQTKTFIQSLIKTGTAPAGYHLQVTILPESVQTTEHPDAYFDYLSYHQAWERYNNSLQLRPPIAEGGNDAFANTFEFNSSLNLKAMTFNIRTSGNYNESTGKYAADYDARAWENRKDAVIAYLNNSSADVICLQEVSEYQKNDIAEGITGYSYQYTPYIDTNGAPYGLMTLYKTSIFSFIHYDAFYLSATPEERSVCWDINEIRMGSITLVSHNATKKMFAIANAHFPYGKDDEEDSNYSYQDDVGNSVRGNCRSVMSTKLAKYIFDFSVYGGTFNADAIRGLVNNEGIQETHQETWYNFTTANGYYIDVLPNITSSLIANNHAWKDDLLTDQTAQKTLNDWAMSGGYYLSLRGPWMNQIKGPTDFLFVDRMKGNTYKDDPKIGIKEISNAEIDKDAVYTYNGTSGCPLSCHWPVVADLTYTYRVTQ